MEEVDEIFAEEEPSRQYGGPIDPFAIVAQFLAVYGWRILGWSTVVLYVYYRWWPVLRRWRVARENAIYYKDPDMVLARMEAIQLARERQQQFLIEASERAAQQKRARIEKKRQEMLERLEKYGVTGIRLGTPGEGDYMPLSGGASPSSYRPPKKSPCKGGGCGQ